MNHKNLKVCYFGTYRAEYSRNLIMIEGLRRVGVDVIECHEQLWYGIEDRVDTVQGGWFSFRFLKRVLTTYAKLIRKYRMLPEYDILIIGYPGQFDVLLARILSWIRRKPMVWDIFMSIYLISIERGLDNRNKLINRFLRWWEKFACKLPDLLIIDTSAYAEWFHETHGIKLNRFKLIPTGADDRIFKQSTDGVHIEKLFIVLYYGTFIPNHGIPYIIKAAELLSGNNDILFILIGDGPDREEAFTYAQEKGLLNIDFIGWLDKDDLIEYMLKASICLGAFGTTPQSLMTVQNKIYEAMALARPVVSGDSPSVRQVFKHGESIFLCDRSNPESLASAIIQLYSDQLLRDAIAKQGYQEFIANYTLEKIGARFKSHLLALGQKN
jgi:glycosyltransferase involved in cell wall biosynthesis